MDDSQILKGVLEGCVLAVIARGETYGYEILSVLEGAGFENLMEGTLYPVLTRLEKKGLISCRKAKSPFGPMRKYYSVTKKGEVYLGEFHQSYAKITAAAQKVFDGEITKAKENENG
ncbi:MAG: PadR family transcriptional regulator [Bacilli bacterium]|nr:PadR family transcriptional regulator [Bacilli bacterium]